MAAIQAKVQKIENIASIDDKIKQYKALIAEVFAAKKADDAICIIQSLMGDNVASALAK